MKFVQPVQRPTVYKVNLFIPFVCPTHVSQQEGPSQHRNQFYVIYLNRLQVSEEDFRDL